MKSKLTGLWVNWLGELTHLPRAYIFRGWGSGGVRRRGANQSLRPRAGLLHEWGVSYVYTYICIDININIYIRKGRGPSAESRAGVWHGSIGYLCEEEEADK